MKSLRAWVYMLGSTLKIPLGTSQIDGFMSNLVSQRSRPRARK
jgi:hypothetical protein